MINALLGLVYPGNEVDFNLPSPKLSNRTALMMAIYNGHGAMTLLLIKYPKIDTNQQELGG
jgi:ankyrin repeat protein